MFNKSSQWWFGKNSIFGQAIAQTKYGTGSGGGFLPGSSQESEYLKYGIIGLFVYLVVKK
jgi:hypothetical protein